MKRTATICACLSIATLSLLSVSAIAEEAETAGQPKGEKLIQVEKRQVTGTLMSVNTKQRTMTLQASVQPQIQSQFNVSQMRPVQCQEMVLSYDQNLEVNLATATKRPGKTSIQNAFKTRKKGKGHAAQMTSQLKAGQSVSVIYQQHAPRQTAPLASAPHRPQALSVRVLQGARD